MRGETEEGRNRGGKKLVRGEIKAGFGMRDYVGHISHQE